MKQKQDFLEAIEAFPDDDALKLVYADWLDDRGDPLGQAIRLACELRRLIDECDFLPADLALLSCGLTPVDPGSRLRFFSKHTGFLGYAFVRSLPYFTRETETVDLGYEIRQIAVGFPVIHLELQAELRPPESRDSSSEVAPTEPSS